MKYHAPSAYVLRVESSSGIFPRWSLLAHHNLLIAQTAQILLKVHLKYRSNNFVQILRLDTGPSSCRRLGVILKESSCGSIALEHPIGPFNSSLGNCSTVGWRKIVAMALVIATNPRWNGLRKVRVITLALDIQRFSLFAPPAFYPPVCW